MVRHSRPSTATAAPGAPWDRYHRYQRQRFTWPLRQKTPIPYKVTTPRAAMLSPAAEAGTWHSHPTKDYPTSITVGSASSTFPMLKTMGEPMLHFPTSTTCQWDNTANMVSHYHELNEYGTFLQPHLSYVPQPTPNGTHCQLLQRHQAPAPPHAGDGGIATAAYNRDHGDLPSTPTLVEILLPLVASPSLAGTTSDSFDIIDWLISEASRGRYKESTCYASCAITNDGSTTPPFHVDLVYAPPVPPSTSFKLERNDKICHLTHL